MLYLSVLVNSQIAIDGKPRINDAIVLVNDEHFTDYSMPLYIRQKLTVTPIPSVLPLLSDNQTT